MTCNNCGAELQDGILFCTNCGEKITDKKNCINCGAELNIDAMFCNQCGEKQNGEKSKKLTKRSSKKTNPKRKIILLIIALCIMGSIVACFGWRMVNIHAAKETVKNYCDSIKTLDSQEMNKYVESGKSESLNPESEIERIVVDFIKENVSYMEYDIGTVNIFEKDSDHITIPVRFEYNDASDLFKKAFYDDMEYLLYNEYDSEEEMERRTEEIFNKYLKVEKTERKEKSVEFVCIKNNKSDYPSWIISQIPNDLEELIFGDLEEFMDSDDSSEEENVETNNDGDYNTAKRESSYPDGMHVSSSYIDPMEISGSYSGSFSGIRYYSSATINIYSSPEDNITVGNADILVGSVDSTEIFDNVYTGELKKVDENVYSVVSEGGEDILIGIDYSAESRICFDLYVNNEYITTFYMDEHYES